MAKKTISEKIRSKVKGSPKPNVMKAGVSKSEYGKGGRIKK